MINKCIDYKIKEALDLIILLSKTKINKDNYNLNKIVNLNILK